MTDEDTRGRLALSFAAGLVDGDVDRMASALHPDVRWSVPGTTAISGTAQGVDAVVDRARAIAASDVVVDLEHVLLGVETAAVLLHNTGNRGGVHLDEVVVVVFGFAEGAIVSADNVISDVAGLDAYFAAGA
ncbi:nuclear transport factor 2 family protein [Jatrophihabitans endophyticus]|uniref:nuclear transport factor 2 family protein n=1 Tax=Jatrophihabitans endophyticus TaxID=1206085 RepID=UPI001A095DC5|nr:nuclear transport factor 2 family protein [Jatrophihabitans endophyticus]MBE7187296.1 nuclear transport factor 2 family protein [Jatrophihabitans endophyticus]